MLGLIPTIHNAVYMIVTAPKKLAVVITLIIKITHIKCVVTAITIDINHAVRRYLIGYQR